MIQNYGTRHPLIDMRRFLADETLDKICDVVGVARLNPTDAKNIDSEEDEETTIEYSHAMKRQLQSETIQKLND